MHGGGLNWVHSVVTSRSHHIELFRLGTGGCYAAWLEREARFEVEEKASAPTL